MAFAFISGTNGFVPKATGQVIGYIRRPDRFAINDYVQYIKSDKPQALYAKVSRDEPVRVTSDDQYVWHDGDEAPNTDDGSVPFQFLPIRIVRRRFNWMLGYDAVDSAEGSWEPKLVHVNTATSKAMVSRTISVLNVLETPGNWQGSTSTAKALNGNTLGTWDSTSDAPGDAEYLNISKTYNEAVRRIHLNTNNVVMPYDMRCMMAPSTAQVMAQSPELRNYLRESPYALPELTYEDRVFSQLWGLPRYFQGVMNTVEATVKVAPSKDASANALQTSPPTDSVVGAIGDDTLIRQECKNPDSVVFMSRPGGIDGEFGSPSYSTMQVYYYRHLLTVRAFDEPVNLRYKGDVIDQYAPILAAPFSGWLVTDVLTAV